MSSPSSTPSGTPPPGRSSINSSGRRRPTRRWPPPTGSATPPPVGPSPSKPSPGPWPGGQLRADIDPESVVDQFWGACYHRLLIADLPLTADFARTHADNLVRGLR
ncbi:TetR-like C-terminal domain-containing protein [Micromonospora sp. WMMD964]|uniref:TetR-like C-terminal domain-containing protein n=1 Tax=Micromonospora sp. WMMD964 TaxID=3016091 RepID=UPI0032B58B0C